MSAKKILTYPHLLLRKPATDAVLNDDLLAEVEDMVDTLREVDRGAALAANQIGIDKRIFVLAPQYESQTAGRLVFINPKIIELNGPWVSEDEGCLSFPGISVPVRRAAGAKVVSLSIDGSPFEVKANDFLARVFQHEIDHLEGKLFVDYLSSRQKHQVLEKMLKRR